MTTIYSDADMIEVTKQRKTILSVFLSVTAFYVLFSVGWLIFYMELPYKSPMQYLPKLCVFTASVLYIVFASVFMGIKFHRVNRYYKMLYYLSEGQKNTEENFFVCFARKSLQKDYVDVVSCIFKIWNKKKQEWMEREAYLDKEMDFPDFEMGDLVRYVTQGNMLIQYEIIQKHALTAEELEEA